MVKELHKLIRDETAQSKVQSEILWIAKLLVNPVAAMNCGYNLHKVSVDNDKYWVADAKAANRAIGSNGRGNLRYLYDAHNLEHAAIAEHKTHRDYRIIAG